MRYGFLSHNPPTQSGSALVAASLAASLASQPDSCAIVVRVVDSHADARAHGVAAHLVLNDRFSQRGAAQALADADVVIVQHSFGAFGTSTDAGQVDVLARLSTPSIVVLHDVPERPSGAQQHTIELLARYASAVVTPSRAGHDRLVRSYRVDRRTLFVIGFGALPAHAARPTPNRVLTWGFIGPGKGIEWGVHALAGLADLDSHVSYHAIGPRDPSVTQREDESYRASLLQLASDLGVADRFTIDARFRRPSEVPKLIASADAVLLPYDGDDLAASAVLVEALVAGRPIVATAFPHALELLRHGAGLTVPHRDPIAMASGLRRIFTDRRARRRMHLMAGLEASKHLWPAVARSYRRLAEALVASADLSARRA